MEPLRQAEDAVEANKELPSPFKDEPFIKEWLRLETTQHVRKCLMRLANQHTGLVTQNDTTGELFTIHPRALPSYREFGLADDITVVLYSAARFRKRDKTKTGALEEEDDKGQFSEDLEKALDISNKKLLLWTKPGKHKNWRIPLWRVDAFCQAFSATPEQRDELMMARLQELRDDNDGQSTSEWVAAEWGAQLAEPERLTSDEQEVLEAWRKLAQEWPRGLYGTSEERAFLERAFDAVLKKAERLASGEDAGAALPEEDEERLRERRKKLAADLRRRQEEVTQERGQERRRLPKAVYRDKYLKQLLGSLR